MLSILARAPRLIWARDKTQSLFTKHLLITNVTISVVLSGTGDLMQQYYENLKSRYHGWNKKRTWNVCVSGLFIGPVCHYWYLYLESLFPGRTLLMISKKVLADQLVISPVCVMSFLIVIGFCEGASGQQVKQDLCGKGPDLLKAEWLVWPPAQIINFLFLPTRYRVLYDNIVSLGFDNYYSHVKYRRGKERALMEESMRLPDADEGSSVNDSENNFAKMGYLIPNHSFIRSERIPNELGPYQYSNICGYYYTCGHCHS